MCELQGAVALAQLGKLANVVADRQNAARKFTAMIAGLPGVLAPEFGDHLEPVWWKYALHVDPAAFPGGAVALAGELKKFGVMSAPRYIQKPAFDCQIFREQRTFGNSRWPFTLARPEAVDYRKEMFPGSYGYLERVLVLPWNERYEDIHLEYIAEALRRSVAALS
jgi:perosamine synthetase